jgi:hypothetical protein
VSLAFKHANTIIDHVLSGQQSSAWMRASVTNGSELRTGDRAKIAELRDHKSPNLYCIDTIVPLEGARLRMKDIVIYPEAETRLVDVRLYDPLLAVDALPSDTRTDADVIDISDIQIDSKGLLLGAPSTDLRKLIVPGFRFNMDRLRAGPEISPFIQAYIYSKEAKQKGDPTFHRLNVLDLLKPNYYTQAEAPRFTEADAALMEQGTEAYLASKIGLVLGKMSIAANVGN